MSWHHADYINLFSAIGGMLSAVAAAMAAGLSLKSARESREQQKNAAIFEKERHLFELLLADASRANDNVKGIHSTDWSFSQAANITYAVESARKRIESESRYLDADQISKFRSFFCEQLSHEIISEMKSMDGHPDALYKPKYDWRESSGLLDAWSKNKDFFGYDYLRDSDLED